MKKIIYSVVVAVIFIGCERLDKIQDDPNRVNSSTPDLLLTNIEISIAKNIDLGASMASRQLTNTDGVSATQYYNWQRGSFDNFYKLKQVQKMQEEAERYNEPVYHALAKFINSYLIVETTMVFGDVPYSDALKVKEGISQPKYEAQKNIFLRVLADLEAANLDLAASTNVIKGDLIYKGDVLKWRKLVNSYTLKVLMDLSHHENDTDLEVKSRFQAIVNNPAQYPIFNHLNESAFLHFVDSKGNQYPNFNNNSMQTAYYLEESFVNRLADLKDTRLFRFAAMKNNRPDNDVNNFENYGGLYGSALMNQNTQKAVNGLASRVNSRYYLDPINEPGVLLSYWSIQFVLAEAAERGWIAANPTPFYEEGIRASFAFFNAQMPEGYLTQEKVVLGGTNNIERILTQKHIASFMNSGWQIFYDNRRTGFPKFNIDGGGVLNQGRLPKRWMYPASEATNNNTNLEEAVNRQFNDGDTINGEMWLIK